MHDELIIRRYQEGDEKQIVALLENVFQGWPHLDLKCTPEEYWRWKFLKPGQKKSTITLAESNGQIIGINHSYPVKIKVGNQIIDGCHATDLAIHEDYRRMKIHQRLSELKLKMHKENDGQFNYGEFRFTCV